MYLRTGYMTKVSIQLTFFSYRKKSIATKASIVSFTLSTGNEIRYLLIQRIIAKLDWLKRRKYEAV